MSRKIIILVVLICVILLGVGLGALKEYRYQESIGIVSLKNSIIQTIDDQILVKNKKTGLSFKIPSGWKQGEESLYSFVFVSPDFLPNDKDIFPKKGCIFVAGITNYDKRDLYNHSIWLKERIESILANPEEFENSSLQVLIVDGRYAYKEVYSYLPRGENVKIEIPRIEEAKVYEIETWSSGEDIEQCQKEFDQILATVKIK